MENIHYHFYRNLSRPIPFKLIEPQEKSRIVRKQPTPEDYLKLKELKNARYKKLKETSKTNDLTNHEHPPDDF